MATVRRFHADGARVGLVARDADRLAAVVAELGGNCHAVAADLSEREECVRAVDEIEAALGPVDVLVSNAGVLRRDFVKDVSVQDFEDTYRVNVGASVVVDAASCAGNARPRARERACSSRRSLVCLGAHRMRLIHERSARGLAEVLHESSGSGVRACAVLPG